MITVFNGEQYVSDCIASVLAQSYPNFEVIIADDSSTDASQEKIAAFEDERLRVLPSAGERLGLHKNWTRAYQSADGVYLKHVCHDDLLSPGCLEWQVDMLEAHPEAALAGGRRRIIDDRGAVVVAARGVGSLCRQDHPTVVVGELVARACVKAGTNLLGEPATVLIRRSMLPEPLFESNWNYAIDIEFYLRTVASNSAVIDRRVVSSFRVSTTQLSAVLAKSQARELRALFVELQRRHPRSIRRSDIVEGTLRALFHALARRALYAFLGIRHALTQAPRQRAGGRR